MAEEIEGRNFRFAPTSITISRFFQLVCDGPSHEEPDCGRGAYEAVSKYCRKELDESDTFVLFIEFRTPVNLYLGDV